jgi:2-dehydropantoate 2-reductase
VELMRHAVLGAGGIGGLLAAALARSGDEVVLLLRPATRSRFDGRLNVESVVLGDFEVTVSAASALARRPDALWVATKAIQLESAWSLASPELVAESPVIPLLNGVDHLALLRTRYTNVVAGAIRVESERLSPWRIRQSSPFLRVELAGAEPVQQALRAAGVECRNNDNEVSLLWNKLAFLAPLALATTAADAPLGAVRDDDSFIGCRDEAIAAAQAEGAEVGAVEVRTLHEQAPAEMRSSMQKDVATGQLPELDAIAGPIIRAGERHRFPTSNTDTLTDSIRARLAH